MEKIISWVELMASVVVRSLLDLGVGLNAKVGGGEP
jgi:hypothetical protein